MEIFYFGEPGKKVTESNKKTWTESVGNHLILKNKKYKIISVKFEEDVIEVHCEKI